MIALLAKFIDWSTLQILFAFWPSPATNWQLEEALEFLNGPEFLPAASNAVQLEFVGPRDFKFPTPRPGEIEENNLVYGRLYRCAERWQERPVIMLLDGYPSVGYHSAFPLLARRFNRAGFNVATLVAPCQLQRRPRRPFEESCLDFARAMAQGVAEIRALTGWLLNEGCPSVGLLGVSLGGWLAGLTACSDPRLAAVVLAVPGVRMRCSHPAAWRRVREALQALKPAHEAMDRTRINLNLSRPVIPKENILLIEGIHDLFAARQSIEELWRNWNQPDIWRLPHGHISGIIVGALMPGLTDRVLQWLAPRLESDRKTTGDSAA